ncbi:MAG TPA: hypothetical protein VI942_05015, partial [Thermoanaerobaculia bacterium]|nr:hypothetical protein [Thermoanaerobaculia bacterium]
VPTLVLAFAGERSLRPYLILDGKQTQGYSGVFHPTSWGNYMAFDALSGDDPLDSVYPGYVHFFVRANFPTTPRWLRTGLAEYYETFVADSGVIHIGRPSEAHVNRLRQGWRIPLPQLFEIDQDSPEYRDPEQFASYAAHCWAVVHYFLIGSEGAAAQLPELLARLDRGEPVASALPAALDYGVAELERRLRLYIKQQIFRHQTWKLADLEPPALAPAVELPREQVLTLLGEYLAHAGADAAAREHLEGAADSGYGDALALLGFLADEDGRVDEARDLYRRSAGLPLRRASAAAHAAAFVLYRSAGATGAGDSDGLAAARAAVERALELDPEFGEAWALKGLAALEAGDPSAALVALSEAQRRLPARADIAYNRFLAALDSGQATAARGIATGSLARLDPERAAEALRDLVAREQIELANRAFEAADRAMAEARYDDALAALNDAAARVTDPAIRGNLEQRRRELEAYALRQKRVDAYNRAVAMANEGKYDDAERELSRLLADCPDPEPVCGAARELLGQLSRHLEKKR